MTAIELVRKLLDCIEQSGFSRDIPVEIDIDGYSDEYSYLDNISVKLDTQYGEGKNIHKIILKG